MLALLAFLTVFLPIPVQAQEAAPRFYFGVDLSYVNEVEDCGAVYRENGEAQEPFALFARHGATLVRARLWHNPDWTHYSTLDDVKRTFTRARDAGMAALLDIHYSDNWADAGTQQIPAAWASMDDDALVDAVYEYTYDVLTALAAEDLIPAFVQVGNETNSGILKRGSRQDWARDARLFNTGIRAVRDFSAEHDAPIQIILHVAQPENTGWWFTEAEAAGITDFDVIGISYYPQWSTFSIADMGAQVSYLRQRFGKAVMVLEAAYPWTREALDESANNILTQGLRGYPVSPAGQRRFLTDLTQALISNGASGIVYWEPAWVSTECSTRWGQGSHWENATFFDFNNDNEVLEGIDFLSDTYLYPERLVDGVIDDEYGQPVVEDAVSDALENVAAFDLGSLYLHTTGDMLSLAFTVAGDVYAERGSYLIYVDTTQDDQGADVDVGRRPITAAEPYLPEYRLDITIREERGTITGSYTLNAWQDGEWQAITFTGGAVIVAGLPAGTPAGAPSVIELQIPRSLFGEAQSVSVAVISTDRTRLHTAGDVLGTAATPADWEEALVLDTFYSYALPD